MELLKKLYKIYSPSGKERAMIKFIWNYTKRITSTKVETDAAGNLYITKGEAECMKTGRFCPKCGRMPSKSKIKGYSLQCKSCNEDFYRIEVLTGKQITQKQIAMEKIIEDFLSRIQNETGKYHLTTIEEWECMCNTFRYIQSGEADMKENWIGIIGRNSTYYDGYGNGPVVDVKYGRFFICPEKKLMRGQAFEEFYEGRNVD